MLNEKCMCWCLSIIDLKNARWNIEIWKKFPVFNFVGSRHINLSYTDLCFICALTNLIAGISGYVVRNFQHDVLYRL